MMGRSGSFVDTVTSGEKYDYICYTNKFQQFFVNIFLHLDRTAPLDIQDSKFLLF